MEHKTSPLVWLQEEDGRRTYLGGRDDTIAWCRRFVSMGEEAPHAPPSLDVWNPAHGFEYDLVVIGGGSGGLACSKEAAKLGAKVTLTLTLTLTLTWRAPKRRPIWEPRRAA